MNEGRPLSTPELAGYRVDELIGRGGMGEVYRALDVRLGRPVALKVLAAGVAGDERFRERLLSESRLAASLDHPNVVPIYEAGEVDGRLFIAMRYVPGSDLRAVLRREGKLAPARAVAIAVQLAGALDAAHRGGLVHRDVKPSNVLLDRQDGREHCYLADFGLTQSASDARPGRRAVHGHASTTSRRSRSAATRWTAARISTASPACCSSASPARCRTHSGRSWPLSSPTSRKPPPAASERGADLPPALDAVLARGMAKDPGERFESCAALVSAVSEALGAEAPPPARRSRLVALLAATVLVLGALVAVGLLTGGEEASVHASGRRARAGGPRHERRDRPHRHPRAPRPAGGHAGRPLDRGLSRRRPVALRAGRPPARADHVERRAARTWPRSATKSTWAADGRFLSGVVSRYDAVTGVREDGIDLLACAMVAGEGVVWSAGCPAVQRLSSDRRKLRKLHEVVLPYQAPSSVENARVQFRELALGEGSLWVLGDALDRRIWRLDARTGADAGHDLARLPATSADVADGKVWVTDGLHDTVVPLDASTGRLLKPVPVGRGASGVAAGRARSGW